MNKTILIGRLTRDPELRVTQSNTKVVSFTVAVNRRVQTPGQPDADFINCVAWNKTAELIAQYFFKGSRIGIDGRIQTRNYDNQQGQRVYVTEVVADSIDFIDTKEESQAVRNATPYNQPSQATKSGSVYLNDVKNDGALEITSEDLPF